MINFESTRQTLIDIKKRTISNSGLKRYFFNSTWLVGEKLLRLIIGLFVGLYVARYLGPTNFGILNYAAAFVAIFTILAPLGLDEIIINELIINPQKKNKVLGTGFVLKCFGVVLSIILTCITFLFNVNDSQTNTYICIILINLLFQPFFIIDFYFQSQVKAKYLVKANIISLILNSLIRLFLVVVKADLIYFVIVTVLDSLIVAIGLVYFYSKEQLRFATWNFSKSLAFKMLKQSWPLIISSIAIMVYMRIDQLMLKQMTDFKTVGIYSAAVKISELWYFIPMAIGGSLFPAIINAKKISHDLYIKRMQAFISLMVIISFPIAIIVALFSTNIIVLLYGLNFQAAGAILSVHIWTGIFVFIGVASGKYLIIEGLTKLSLYRSLWGAVANVVLNFILIPILGGLGAAISTLIAQMIATYFFDYFNPRTRELFYIKTKALFFIFKLKETMSILK